MHHCLSTGVSVIPEDTEPNTIRQAYALQRHLRGCRGIFEVAEASSSWSSMTQNSVALSTMEVY